MSLHGEYYGILRANEHRINVFGPLAPQPSSDLRERIMNEVSDFGLSAPKPAPMDVLPMPTDYEFNLIFNYI